MKVPDPPVPALRVLAVDDFALRRSRRYGMLVVDVDSRLPVDGWEGRDAESLAVWLRAHPGIEVVCRDGSQTYRAAISTSAPEAIQVSDRFHLWQGLGRKVYEVVTAHRACLTPPGAPAAPEPTGRTAMRTRRLHAAVHARLEEGMAIRAIARDLNLDRNAGRRYARAATWAQAAPTWPKRAGILAPYQAYVHQRWAEGEHNIVALHREIAARGFCGSEATVRRYASTQREALDANRSPPAPVPSVCDVSWWLMARPERLDEDRRATVKQLLARCPELDTLYDRIRSFAAIFTKRRTDLLDRWITQVKTDGIAPLASYATGLLDDLDAVRGGVRLPYSSGIAEGRVTDLKMIKRQMAGRAGIRLLRN